MKCTPSARQQSFVGPKWRRYVLKLTPEKSVYSLCLFSISSFDTYLCFDLSIIRSTTTVPKGRWSARVVARSVSDAVISSVSLCPSVSWIRMEGRHWISTVKRVPLSYLYFLFLIFKNRERKRKISWNNNSLTSVYNWRYLTRAASDCLFKSVPDRTM